MPLALRGGADVSGIKNDTFTVTSELPINFAVRPEVLVNTSLAQAREALTNRIIKIKTRSQRESNFPPEK